MKLVIIESPYRGDIEYNLMYARAAMRDSINRGEAPFASHLLYPQVLDDDATAERVMGIELGWQWYRGATLVAFYTDLGMSEGMQSAFKHVLRHHLRHEFRTLQALPQRPVHAPYPDLQPQS